MFSYEFQYFYAVMKVLPLKHFAYMVYQPKWNPTSVNLVMIFGGKIQSYNCSFLAPYIREWYENISLLAK